VRRGGLTINVISPDVVTVQSCHNRLMQCPLTQISLTSEGVSVPVGKGTSFTRAVKLRCKLSARLKAVPSRSQQTRLRRLICITTSFSAFSGR
jgi:hypothetical protein